MQRIGALPVGDLFRPAYDNQGSMNDRKMSRDEVYQVVKIYPMEPHFVISVRRSAPEDGYYSLPPNVPIIMPREPAPSVDEILEFLGIKRRKRIVAYRVLWDGETDIVRILPPAAVAVVRLMFAGGKSEYSTSELGRFFSKHFNKFYSKSAKMDGKLVLMSYRRRMVECGLLEEILDDGPAIQTPLGVNLREVV